MTFYPDDLEEDWIKQVPPWAIREAYNPGQPRNPRGSPHGGEFASSRGGAGSTGGATGQRGRMAPAEGEAKIQAMEALIAHNNYETGVVFRNGELVGEARGDSHSVEVGSQPGDVVLHNHPSDSTLSLQDGDSAFGGELGEVRSVGPSTYSRLAPAPGQKTFNAADQDRYRQAVETTIVELGIGQRVPGGVRFTTTDLPSLSQQTAMWNRIATKMRVRFEAGSR